jgi:hypothetical protein
MAAINIMNRKIFHNGVLVCLSFALVALTGCTGSTDEMKQNNPLDWVYRDKIRMGWSPARLDQYQLMADAGMNAVMPRHELDVVSHYDPKNAATPLSPNDATIIAEIRDGSRMAKKTGLHYFHCLNLAAQAQTYQAGFENNPARYNDGNLPSPVDPIYWQRTITDRVRRVLDLLQDENEYALDAVIIDPEMYALKGALPGAADYGTYAFETFLQDTGKNPSAQKPTTVESRREWIVQNGLQKEFESWQFARIEKFGRELEKMVHARRPNLILGYIIYENKMWFHAMAKGLSTPALPAFIGPETTYSGVMDERMIAYLQQIRDEVKTPALLVPGVMLGLEHDKVPQEFLNVVSGNIYQRTRYSEGYWVYAIYNFGETAEQQKPFFAALKKANDALDFQAKTGKLADLPAAPIPVPKPANFDQVLANAPRWKALPTNTSAAKQPYAPAKLRGSFSLMLWPQKPQPATLTVTAIQLGAYLDQCDVALFDQTGAMIWKDFSPIGRALEIKAPDTTSDVIGCVVGAGWNAFAIEDSNCPLMIAPEDFLSVNAQRGLAGRFYFYVPQDCKNFKLTMQGEGGEYADFTVFDADNKVALEEKQLSNLTTKEIPVTKAGVWCVQIDNAIDDAGIKLEGIPNLFALRPEYVRAPQAAPAP